MKKPLSFKIISDHLLLCVFLLSGVTDSSTTSPQATTLTTIETDSSKPASTVFTTPMTTPTTPKPPPDDVNNVNVTSQTETNITLMWEKVNNISTYILQYRSKDSSVEESIDVSNQETPVTYVVSPLTAGTIYNFTLITVLEGVNSTGFSFQSVTAPKKVNKVNVSTQNKTSITLMWDKVDDISTYILQYRNKDSSVEESIDVSNQETPVTYVVSPLTAGTIYNFTLITVFEEVNSTGLPFEGVTAPDDVNNVTVTSQTETSITLMWEKVNNIPTYILQYQSKASFEEKSIDVSDQETPVTYVVSPLTAGTIYNFTLITVFERVNSTGLLFQGVTAPKNVNKVNVSTQNKTSITLMWDKVDDISTYILQYRNKDSSVEESIDVSNQETPVTYVVSPLTAGTIYNFTLITVFEEVNSTGLPFEGVTAPENVNKVNVSTQNETSITLMWDKVDDISTYILQYRTTDSFEEKSIDVSDQETVTHVVSPLTAGTVYNFTLITVFERVNSTGLPFEGVTAPENVKEVDVPTQNETSITLMWEKVNNISTYILQYRTTDSFEEKSIDVSDQETPVIYVVSQLTAGTIYNCMLITVFERVSSTGFSFQNVTAPENVNKVNVLAQNETSITLMWDKVNSISTYILQYRNKDSSVEESIDVSNQETPVTYVVSLLTAGTIYNFTLMTVFERVNSTGLPFRGVTAPENVNNVTVTSQTETSISLMWEKVNNIPTYILQYQSKASFEEKSIDVSDQETPVTYVVSPLTAGTMYNFTLFSVFERVNSSGFSFQGVTAMRCSSIAWDVTNSSIHGMIEGVFTRAIATYKSQHHFSSGGSNVLFASLVSGATYKVSFEYKGRILCSTHVTTIPPYLNAHCEYLAAGYSILVVWDKPDGVWTTVEVNVTDKTSLVHEEGAQQQELSGFLPARTYEVSVTSLSGNVRSYEPHVFSCLTDPRGVIAGSVCAVLLFVALVCLAMLILRKRPDIIRKSRFIGGSKLSNKKSKAIPTAKFPEHFYQLSIDENRGFIQEYEDLSPVGTEQTRKEATQLDNKPRNRFNNVLPYDWCRVKLTTSNPNQTSDYINASYMPGYSSNREYIATQGPLPSTVNDFWRMIWEQRIKGIVMVTNCIEGGRTKCEQYWPAGRQPCPYGELSVTMTSEQQEPNWTLREFRVKHNNTSEERTVKHFHFTAWPDHGVPQGTEVLIQFRGLVRQHIERDGAGAPTVVHCSAGVGRTGTIIALDVLLQQLDKDRAVGINAFVHKMRLNRPYMVQTESQYVFLHHCIMDCLKPKEKTEENIYENADIIYANATALREFHSNA